MKKFFYGFALSMVVFIGASVVTAGIVSPDLTLSKADLKYSATSTESLILTESELIKIKEEYNNTDRIVEQLRELNLTLKKVEKLLK